MTAKHTPGPWTFQPTEKWPFGFEVKSAAGEIIMSQDAICWASGQKTRQDNLTAVGFPSQKEGRMANRNEAVNMIAEQDANGRLIAAAPDMLVVITAIKMAFDMGFTAAEILAPDSEISRAINAAIAKATGEKT